MKGVVNDIRHVWVVNDRTWGHRVSQLSEHLSYCTQTCRGTIQVTGKILVVEDVPEILEMLVHSLQKSGFTVLCAEDGLSACRIIGSEQPDWFSSTSCCRPSTAGNDSPAATFIAIFTKTLQYEKSPRSED